MENYYFECQCASFNHIFKIVHDQKDNSVWLETHLNHYLPWYKRVVAAFRFIFKMKSCYDHFDSTMLCPKDMESLTYLVDDYIEFNTPMVKAEALALMEHAKTHPDHDKVVKGIWICNLQGTDNWVLDTMSHNGQFIRVHNRLKITPN